MSTTITHTHTTITQDHTRLRNARPSFVGIVRGELLKISRLRMTWIMLLLTLGISSVYYVALLSRSDIKSVIQQEPLTVLYQMMTNSLGLYRVFSGIFLLVLVAYVFGLEYQQGTIRILLARGVGRLQLLWGKLVSLVIVGLGLLLLGIILNAILISLFLLIITGSVDALKAADTQFWQDTGLYLLTILINMSVTILLATALTVISRSLALGLTLSVLFFPADNIGTSVMYLVNRLTHNQFWLDVTQYFLGPNLNIMPSLLLSQQARAYPIIATPLVKVDASHTLWTAAIYAAIFLVAAVLLTWKRDVKE